MRIAFVTSAWDAGGGLNGVGTYRCLLPAKALRSVGHEVCITPNALANPITGELRALDPDGTSIGDIDVIVYVAPPPGNFADTIWNARLQGQKVVMDCDDWFVGLELSHPMRKAVLFDADQHLQAMRKAMTLADMVTFSTSFLADQFPKLRSKVVVRNMIDMSMGWKQRMQADIPTIGWTGRIDRRPHDLTMMRGVLGPAIQTHKLQFCHVGHTLGSMNAAEGFGLDALRVTNVDACPFEDYVTKFDFDIGIVPLANTRFNRSKSWLKRLEYGACAIPSVASELPEQKALMPWGLARKPIDWRKQLQLMIRPSYRLEKAQEALDIAWENDITKRGHEWVMAIESVAS